MIGYRSKPIFIITYTYEHGSYALRTYRFILIQRDYEGNYAAFINTFTDYYLSLSTYPIKVLLLVCQLYGLNDIDDGLYLRIIISRNEKKHKRIMNQMWFTDQFR